jgi:hypothetical protein
MDEGTSLHLLSTYDGRRSVELPDRFLYNRRLGGGARGHIAVVRRPPDEAPGGHRRGDTRLHFSLGELYQRLQSGALKLGMADGQWTFGLTMPKESLAL